MAKITIFDTTLRDGEQSPGATMSTAEKLRLAIQLDKLGVDVIEAGFPVASDDDFEGVRTIVNEVRRPVIAALARAHPLDVDRAGAAVEAAANPRIHVFLATSDIHLKHKLEIGREECLERVIAGVERSKKLVDDVEFSPEDATRTEVAFLCQIVQAAVEAGARQIECTINGLGERAGNTALEEVVMALRVRHDIMPFDTGIDTTKIIGLSRRVAQVSGFPVQFNKAIVGKNAFAHESGIHQDGMLKNAETFEIMLPEDIGLASSSLPLGKHSGRAALRDKLKGLGYDDVGENQLKDVFVRFKALADRKKEVYDDDIIALMQVVSGDAINERIKLKFLRVICGTEAPQSADINLTIDGVDHQHTATGDGPVDATFNAVKALFPTGARLELYQVSAVTEGTDAQATVSVRLSEDGRIATGQSSDTDTVVASAKAYITALNRLQVRKKSTPEVRYTDAS